MLRQRSQRGRKRKHENEKLDLIVSGSVNIAAQQLHRSKVRRLNNLEKLGEKVSESLKTNFKSLDELKSKNDPKSYFERNATEGRINNLRKGERTLLSGQQEFNYEKLLCDYVRSAGWMLSDPKDSMELANDLTATITGTHSVSKRNDEEICPFCGSLMLLTPAESLLTCPSCSYFTKKVHPTSSGMIQTMDMEVDAENKGPHQTGVGMNHFLRLLHFYMATQKKDPPDEICDKVCDWFYNKAGISKTSDITWSDAKCAIGGLGLPSSYFGYTTSIYCRTTGKIPPCFLPREIVMLLCCFIKARSMGAPCNYKLITGLFLYHIGMHDHAQNFLPTMLRELTPEQRRKKSELKQEYLKHIQEAKSEEERKTIERHYECKKKELATHSITPVVREQCLKWKQVCEKLGWRLHPKIAKILRPKEPKEPKRMQIPEKPLIELPVVFENEQGPEIEYEQEHEQEDSEIEYEPPFEPPSKSAPVREEIPEKPIFVPNSEKPVIYYKFATECDRKNFFRGKPSKIEKSEISWDMMRYEVLTSGGTKDPCRKGKCHVHLVGWKYEKWGNSTFAPQEDWLNINDVVRAGENIVIGRLPCQRGYKPVIPFLNNFHGEGVSDETRIQMVIDKAVIDVVQKDEMDPLEHNCDLEPRRKRVRLPHPHGIPKERLRPPNIDETPEFIDYEGNKFVLRDEFKN
jgi:hypothetical protein